METLLGPGNKHILRKWYDFVAVDGKLYGRRRSCYSCDQCIEEGNLLKCTETVKCGEYAELIPVDIPGTTRSRSFVNRLNQPDGTVLKKVINFVVFCSIVLIFQIL